MHNLTLNEEQSEVQSWVRKFVNDVAGPVALDRDEQAQFVREGFDGLAELGLFGVALSEDAGGAGLGVLALAVALEEIGRACTSTGRMLLTQAGYCLPALEGVDAASETVAALAAGESIGAFVGAEWRVTARVDGDGFVLDGAAAIVTGAAEAALFVVVAVIDDEAALFVVPADRVTVEPVTVFGFRACGSGSVRLDGLTVGAETCVVRGADAAAAIARAETVGRIGASALAVGSAFGSIELSARHAAERIAFGKPLVRQQAVADKIVESRRRADAARHLCWHAARLVDDGADATEVAMIARLTAVEAAVHAGDEGIQIHGGYGYTVEYHVERHYRDAQVLGTLDGGDRTMRDALALGVVG